MPTIYDILSLEYERVYGSPLEKDLKEAKKAVSTLGRIEMQIDAEIRYLALPWYIRLFISKDKWVERKSK